MTLAFAQETPAVEKAIALAGGVGAASPCCPREVLTRRPVALSRIALPASPLSGLILRKIPVGAGLQPAAIVQSYPAFSVVLFGQRIENHRAIAVFVFFNWWRDWNASRAK